MPPDLNDTTSTDLSALWDEMSTAPAEGGTETPASAGDPSGDPAAQPTARDRDPQGRFAPKAGETAAAAPITKDAQAANPTAAVVPAAAAAPAAQDGTEPVAATDAASAPPKGWTPAAKAEWDKLSPSVREAIAKREDEVSTGFKRYEGMAKYADVAERNGDTLAQFSQKYINAEAYIQRDLTGAVLWLAEAQGLNPQALVDAIAARVNGQSASPQNPGRQPPAPQPDVRSAVREVLEHNTLTTEVNTFFADPKNLYAENVRPLMADLLNAGRASSLKDAYDMACRADPQVWAAIQATASRTPAGAATTTPVAPRADAVTQARKRSGSLTGSPLPAGTSRDPTATQRQVDGDLWDQHVG